MLLRFITLLLALAAATASLHGDEPAATAGGEESHAFQAVDTSSGLSLHRNMYALPLTVSNRYDGEQSEIVFRLSAKLRVLGSRFFLGFTQISFWQAYNNTDSSPFRETNYNPEIIYRRVPSNSSFRRWGFDLGFEHESNGSSEPDSRSWNRFYGTIYREQPKLLVSLKVWSRLHEDRCPIGEDGLEIESCRDDSGFDDNPDIDEFLGYSRVDVHYRWTGGRGEKEIRGMLQGNLATGKGAVSVEYSHPSGSDDLYWFAKGWAGYGESLIDYNRSVTRFGIGVLLRR